MIQAYPPGAKFPKKRSVSSPNSPSAVALIAGAEVGHGNPALLATVDRGPSEPITTRPWNVPWFVSTASPRTRVAVVSTTSSEPSWTALSARAWSILSRRTVNPLNGIAKCLPFGVQIRITGVSISFMR